MNNDNNGIRHRIQLGWFHPVRNVSNPGTYLVSMGYYYGNDNCVCVKPRVDNRIKMADNTSLGEGTKFSTFEELSQSIKSYEERNFVTLYTRSSRTVEATRRRAPNKKFNDKLHYSELDYACIHGGRVYKSKSNSRKDQK